MIVRQRTDGFRLVASVVHSVAYEHTGESVACIA